MNDSVTVIYLISNI